MFQPNTFDHFDLPITLIHALGADQHIRCCWLQIQELTFVVLMLLTFFLHLFWERRYFSWFIMFYNSNCFFSISIVLFVNKLKEIAVCLLFLLFNKFTNALPAGFSCLPFYSLDLYRLLVFLLVPKFKEKSKNWWVKCLIKPSKNFNYRRSSLCNY